MLYINLLSPESEMKLFNNCQMSDVITVAHWILFFLYFYYSSFSNLFFYTTKSLESCYFCSKVLQSVKCKGDLLLWQDVENEDRWSACFHT